jgi:hypothetical protein
MKKQLPIRAKIEIAEKIGQILHYFQKGQPQEVNALIAEVKSRALFLEDPIQQDVLIFAESVQFQEAYDPWHKISPEIEQAANKLIEDLGFTPPSEEKK